MTKVKAKQGEGNGTRRKESGFRVLFEMVLKATSGEKLSRYPYWHLDLNCGSGFNTACLGSPLVFVDEAVRQGRVVYAQFCDEIPEFTTSLASALVARRLPREFWTAVYTMDNGAFLRDFCDNVPRNAVGTIVCDPNGIGFPARELAAFCQSHARMDLIINLNCRTLRLVDGIRQKVNAGSNKPQFLGIVKNHPEPLARMMEWFSKPYGLIRNPLPVQGDDFSTIFLTGHSGLASAAFKGFHPMSSRIGQQILTNTCHVIDHPIFPEME